MWFTIFITYVNDILSNDVKDYSGYVKKSRVLLVDNEPDIVYLVKTGLERNGLEVDAYTDPLLALQNFKSSS